MRRRDLLLAALVTVVAATAQGQESRHWLIGTWIGEVKIPQEKNGTGRRMVVLSVKGADVRLRYGLGDSEQPPIVHGTLKGEELRFVGPGTKLGDNPVVVSRTGPDELAGTWQSRQTGKTYPITFRRQK
jgi:hypothetical protein